MEPLPRTQCWEKGVGCQTLDYGFASSLDGAVRQEIKLKPYNLSDL